MNLQKYKIILTYTKKVFQAPRPKPPPPITQITQITPITQTSPITPTSPIPPIPQPAILSFHFLGVKSLIAMSK